jgi:putative ABC transport system permease protein
VDAEALQSFWRSLTIYAFALVVWISAISLVVGGVAVANTLFASVVERTREIGIRKSVGAKRWQIVVQFLFEAVTLTSTGGLIGILLGWAAAFAVSALSPFPARVTPQLASAGFGVAVASGLVAGLLPALRAARLDPVEALRDE